MSWITPSNDQVYDNTKQHGDCYYTATKEAADNHGIIPRFGRLSLSSKVPCCTTGPTDSADDGRVTPAFGSVGLFAGTVGVDEPVASLDNAGAVPV